MLLVLTVLAIPLCSWLEPLSSFRKMGLNCLPLLRRFKGRKVTLASFRGGGFAVGVGVTMGLVFIHLKGHVGRALVRVQGPKARVVNELLNGAVHEEPCFITCLVKTLNSALSFYSLGYNTIQCILDPSQYTHT
jgi:hypothetical protein